MRHLRNIASFLLMAGSAYAFSFAADLLFGRFFSQFPDTVWVPIGTWLIISMFLAFFASLLSGSFAKLLSICTQYQIQGRSSLGQIDISQRRFTVCFRSAPATSFVARLVAGVFFAAFLAAIEDLPIGT